MTYEKDRYDRDSESRSASYEFIRDHQFPQLFILQNNRDISAEDMTIMVTEIERRYKNLSEINLSEQEITKQQMGRFIRALNKHHNLKRLVLLENIIIEDNGEVMNELIQALKKNKELCSLELTGQKFDIKQLIDLLNYNTSIVEYYGPGMEEGENEELKEALERNRLYKEIIQKTPNSRVYSDNKRNRIKEDIMECVYSITDPNILSVEVNGKNAFDVIFSRAEEFRLIWIEAIEYVFPDNKGLKLGLNKAIERVPPPLNIQHTESELRKKSLVYKSFIINKAFVEKHILSYPDKMMLTLANNFITDDAMQMILNKNPPVRYLRLRYNKMNDTQVKMLCENVLKMEALNIEGLGDNISLPVIDELIENLKKSKTICYYDGPGSNIPEVQIRIQTNRAVLKMFDDTGLRKLLDENPQLMLSEYGKEILDAFDECINNLTQKNVRLRSITWIIWAINNGIKESNGVKRLLKDHPIKVRIAQIEQKLIDKAIHIGMMTLIDIQNKDYEGDNSVISIVFEDIPIDKENAQKFAEILKKSHKKIELVLNNNRLNDESLQAILQSCAENENIFLEIKRNAVTDHGIEMVDKLQKEHSGRIKYVDTSGRLSYMADRDRLYESLRDRKNFHGEMHESLFTKNIGSKNMFDMILQGIDLAAKKEKMISLALSISKSTDKVQQALAEAVKRNQVLAEEIKLPEVQKILVEEKIRQSMSVMIENMNKDEDKKKLDEKKV